MEKKQYDSIDLMKFICSIFVMMIHSDPLIEITKYGNLLICQGIARLSVPLFFLASSFFLYRKEINEEITKKYVKRMIQLYLIWFVIELPITIYNRFIIDGYPFVISLWRFFRSIFLTSTFSGSWYIVSSIFCALLFQKLQKISPKKRNVIVITLSIISYLLCVFTSGYGGLIEKLGLSEIYRTWEMLFAKPYTSIIVGIPYFAFGKYLAENEKKTKKPPLYLISLSLICLIIEITIVEKIGICNTTDCLIMLFPSSVLIFEFLLKQDIELKKCLKLRKMSTIIFFSQFIWLFALEVIEYISKVKIMSIYKFIISLVLGILFTELLTRLENKNMFSKLKYLY